MTSETVRLGAIGLGRGFDLTAEAFARHPEIDLTAAVARSPEARQAFENSFSGRAFETLEDMLAGDLVEMVYVATPHELHRPHAIACMQAGKHVVVEKPIALSLKDADDMIAVARQNGVHLIIGPCHSFDAPVLKAAEIIATGRLGNVRMLHALNCTEFLYRPRTPEELDTSQGGGVVFSQAIHQIDVARRLMGRKARSVTAMTGKWDQARPTEGAYSLLIRFEGEAFANLTYSGFAHFDSDIWMNNISELGRKKSASSFGNARRNLKNAANELHAKNSRKFSRLKLDDAPENHEHFGPVIVFCDEGDLQLNADGVTLFGNEAIEKFDCPFAYSRQSFADAIISTVRHNRPPVQDGSWGKASLEICHAILKSAETASPVDLHFQ